MSNTTAKLSTEVTVKVNDVVVTMTGNAVEVVALIEVLAGTKSQPRTSMGAVVQQPKAEAKAGRRSRRSTKSNTATTKIQHLVNGEVYDRAVDSTVFVGAKGTKTAILGTLASGKAFRIRSNGAVYKVA